MTNTLRLAEELSRTESDLQEANDTIGALEYRVRELEAECDRLHKQLKDTTEALRLVEKQERQLSVDLMYERFWRDTFGGKAGR